MWLPIILLYHTLDSLFDTSSVSVPRDQKCSPYVPSYHSSARWHYHIKDQFFMIVATCEHLTIFALGFLISRELHYLLKSRIKVVIFFDHDHLMPSNNLGLDRGQTFPTVTSQLFPFVTNQILHKHTCSFRHTWSLDTVYNKNTR